MIYEIFLFFYSRIRNFLLFADESRAFKIWLDAELRRGSSRVRGNEALVRGSVSHQPDHSRGQDAFLESEVVGYRDKELIPHYIITAFVYCNRFSEPNGVSVHVGWIIRYFAQLRLRPRARSSKYYPILYPIKNIYFSCTPFLHFPLQDHFSSGHSQNILNAKLRFLYLILKNRYSRRSVFQTMKCLSNFFFYNYLWFVNTIKYIWGSNWSWLFYVPREKLNFG